MCSCPDTDIDPKFFKRRLRHYRVIAQFAQWSGRGGGYKLFLHSCFFTAFLQFWDYSNSKDNAKQYTHNLTAKLQNSNQNSCLPCVNFIGLWTTRPRGRKVKHSPNINRLISTQIAILITDGKQTTDRGPYRQLADASSGLKSKKVQVYSIGIGTNLDQKQLEDIASSKDKVFYATGFANLAQVGQQIVQNSCTGKLCSQTLGK